MVLNIIWALLSACAFFGTLFWSLTPYFVDDDGNAPMGALIGEIAAAVVFAVLAFLAIKFTWWLFFPIALVIMGIWARVSYSHMTWLVLVTFVLAGWSAACPELTSFNDFIKLLAGRFLALPAGIVIFWFFASWGLKRSADEPDDDEA